MGIGWLFRKMGRTLLVCSFISSIMQITAQTKETHDKLCGKVLNESNQPVAGANIVIYDQSGVPHGTIADTQGCFSLDCPKGATEFQVRMLGYQPFHQKIDPKQIHYEISLKTAVESLSDVVVTGYIDKKKESYTGASHTVIRQEIEEMVHTNVLNIIQLRAPGFELFDDIANGSDPNHLPDMVLRGRSSFIEGDKTNVPLFILDGTEVDIGYVFDMPAEDIESITVLKDAAATSFYGSKAANGVVVITTRPTQFGRLQVNYTGNFQVSIPDLSDYRLLNAREKLEYERLAGLYGDFSGSSSSDVNKQKTYYERLERVNAGINTNWMRQALRTGLNHIHSLNLSGGSRDFRYNVSGNYNATNGVMDKSDKTTASLRINLTYGNMEKLFFQNIMSVSHSTSNDVPYGSFSDYVRLNPYDTPYLEDGSLNNDLAFNAANPLYEKNLSSYIRNVSGYFIDTFRIRWNIRSSLRMEASISYNRSTVEGETFYSPLSKRFYDQDPSKRGSFNVSNGTSNTLSGNAFIVWNLPCGTANNGLLSMTAGINIESSQSESHSFEALGVLSDKLEHPSMAIGYSDSGHPGGSEELSRMLGGFFSANFSWKNRYFIDVSFRYEGSSKFGTDNKFAPFGAIGIGWNLHRERFFESSVFSLFKVRASIGMVGNAGFNAYQAQLSYRYEADLLYNGSIGAVPVSMVNPRLKWERSLKRNIGLDIGLWKDRINGSIDVYYDTTNNLVMAIAKPNHIGFPNAMENLGKIRNSGIEISMRGNVFRKNSSSLNIYANMSHNKNRIVAISDYLKNKNKENEANATSSLPAAFYEEGESMTALKVMRSAGINPANGKEVFITRDGQLTYEYDYRDKQVVGDTTPKLQGAVGFSFDVHAFNLSVSLGYRLGATIYNQTLATKVEGADPTANADRRVFHDRWKAPGDRARYKNIANREATPPTDRFIATEYALEGSSMKLSYSFPKHFCQKIGLRQIRIAASVGDLFNLSTVKRERGLDYPFARVFQMSLTVNL